MKKHITLILILMSLCVTGIAGLQLFWNYQNYQNTIKTFDHDINEALDQAVARETAQRQDLIVKRFEGWLADTALITISADHKNRDSNTIFYIQDTHPRFAEDKKRKMQFGVAEFKEKLDHITPRAKAIVIRHFGDRILKRDLESGTVYYYTQMLGDSLENVFGASKVDPVCLAGLFREELLRKNISTSFILNPEPKGQFYLTRPVNTSFRKPYQKYFVYAGFESPHLYFFKKMKWIVITSLLLIGITIACFAYTVRILLSQGKLAELKKAFVSNMIHELNTPIASIKITAESLKSFRHQPERQSEYVDIIGYQAEKLAELTAQILRTDELAPTDEKNRTVFDLNEVVMQGIVDMRPQAEIRRAQINFQPAASPVTMRGERSKLRYVLTNIIDNALKYTDDVPLITIRLIVAGNFAELSVADNGIGIPPEYREKVFGQFFRVPRGNLHNVKGYGLGLSYVRQVVEQHKGSIRIGANKPSGSIITLKLPSC